MGTVHPGRNQNNKYARSLREQLVPRLAWAIIVRPVGALLGMRGLFNVHRGSPLPGPLPIPSSWGEGEGASAFNFSGVCLLSQRPAVMKLNRAEVSKER